MRRKTTLLRRFVPCLIPSRDKRYLNDILQAELDPIRARRKELEQNPDYIYEILKKGSERARAVAAQTLSEVRDAMGIEYFKGMNF